MKINPRHTCHLPLHRQGHCLRSQRPFPQLQSEDKSVNITPGGIVELFLLLKRRGTRGNGQIKEGGAYSEVVARY